MFYIIDTSKYESVVFDNNTNSSTFIDNNDLKDILIDNLGAKVMNVKLNAKGIESSEYDLETNGYIHICRLINDDGCIYKLVSNGGEVVYVKDGMLKKYMRKIKNKRGKEYMDRFVAKSKLLGNNIEIRYYVEGDNVLLERYKGNSDEFIIPNVVTSLGKELGDLFDDNDIEVINIPDNVKYIGNYVFYNCEKLKINLGKNVKRAYEGTFFSLNNVKGLKGVSLLK